MKKYEEENFLGVGIRDRHKIEAARVKKYNPAIRFYEVRYGCKK